MQQNDLNLTQSLILYGNLPGLLYVMEFLAALMQINEKKIHCSLSPYKEIDKMCSVLGTD